MSNFKDGIQYSASDFNTEFGKVAYLRTLASHTTGQGSSLVGDSSGATVHDLLPIHLQFSTYADLRNYSHISGVDIVQITGDGIAGIFKADPSDTTTADNGGTVIVAADGTRWKRRYSFLMPEYFGAVGDATTDSTTAFQAAAATGESLYPGPGVFLVNGRITLASSQSIIGRGKAQTTIRQTGTVATSSGLIFADSGAAATTLNNISINDITLDGNNTTLGGFSQYQHILSFNGVRNVNISGCQFLGYRGDGVYIGSGTTGTDERHNFNVTIEGNVFDGVNNNNRNGVSVIDGDGVRVASNRFRNCTRSTMPGAIDVEPDANAFHVVKNIDIEDNVFESVGGNSGLIGIILSAATFTTQPQNFNVRNNKSSVADKNFLHLKNTITTYGEPFNVSMTGNTGTCNRAWNCTSYIRGFVAANNTLLGKRAALLGYNDGDQAIDCVLSNNVLTSDGSQNDNCIVLKSGNNIVVMGNSFANWYAANVAVGGANSSISAVSILNNTTSPVRGADSMAARNGGVDGASCRYAGNVGGDLHTFPAWRTDNGGRNTGTFGTATLPDSFPIGTSITVINGDTGVPATGGNQGTLKTERVPATNGYEKWTYQTYYPANNNTKNGDFFVRQRQSTSNAWTAWFEHDHV